MALTSSFGTTTSAPSLKPARYRTWFGGPAQPRTLTSTMGLPYASQQQAADTRRIDARAREAEANAQRFGSKPPGPPPPDAAYEAIMGTLDQRRKSIVSGLKDEQTSTLLDYGYNAQYDPSDPFKVTGLSFDPNNPYSRAALAQRAYNNNQRGATNSYAAQGQLYSGALQNVIDPKEGSNAFNYGQQTDALQKALTALLTGIRGRRDRAEEDFSLGAGQALSDKLTRASA